MIRRKKGERKVICPCCGGDVVGYILRNSRDCLLCGLYGSVLVSIAKAWINTNIIGEPHGK